MPDITLVPPLPAETKLVGLDTVKAVLGITDASQDAALTIFIDEATSMAEGFCNRVFAQARLQERHRKRLAYDPERAVYVIPLSRPPIVEIHEVRNPDGEVIPAEAYEVVDPDAGLLGLSAFDPHWWTFWWSSASMPSAPYRIQIEYTGGFVLPYGAVGTPALPAAVSRGAIEYVKNVQTSAARASDVVSERIGDYSVRYESQSDLIKATGGSGASLGGQLTTTVRSALAPYKIYAAG